MAWHAMLAAPLPFLKLRSGCGARGAHRQAMARDGLFSLVAAQLRIMSMARAGHKDTEYSVGSRFEQLGVHAAD